jgi:hypothetical protein
MLELFKSGRVSTQAKEDVDFPKLLNEDRFKLKVHVNRPGYQESKVG